MKDSKQPGVVTLAILTALTSILWVFFSVIRTLSEEPVSPVSPEILEPINPNLDLETLDRVRDGLVFDEGQTETIQINPPENEVDQEQETLLEDLSAFDTDDVSVFLLDEENLDTPLDDLEVE